MAVKENQEVTGKSVFAGKQGYQDPEVWAKVTGKAVYGSDLSFPGMLYGKILRSPHPHARIKRIDTGKASSLPGVRAVLTAKDITCKPYGIVVKDELPLAEERVRYIGDEVACVCAVDQKTAEQAVEMIEVDYEPLPAVFDPEAALSKEAPQLHQDFPGNITWERDLVRGDPDKAFQEAEVTVEDSFSIPLVHPTYLEPIACVTVSEAGGRLTLYTALQSPDVVRDIIAEALEIPSSLIRINSPVMGGGFGGRVYGNLKLYLLSSLLSIHTGLPVKMQLTRKEEFTVGRPMIGAKIKMKMAFNREGEILAREAEIITDNGAYSAQAPWVSKTLSERNDSLYRIPRIRTKARLAYTNKVPTAQYRAYGNQAANFACESLMNRAAEKLGMDPLTLRLKNCTRAGDVTVHGLQIKSCALEECLQKAASEIGWHRRKENRGYGISAGIHANGSLVANKDFRGAAARAVLELDGRITIYTGEQDYGQGTHAAFARIASAVLGLDPEKINLHSRETLTTPYSQGALAMRQTTIGGRAVQLAAEDLKKAILNKALQIYGERIEMTGGKLKSGSGQIIDFKEVALSYHHETSGLTLVGEGKFVPPPSAYDETSYGNISVTYSFAAHAAEVSVDNTTGELTIHRILAIHDSGRIVNLLAARGQVYGGVTQGLGMSCFEGYIFENGRVLNATLANYRIPTALDCPAIDCHFIEKEDPEGPFGAKGLGEIVMVPVIGAIANAVADAAGVPVTELPITAEKIYRALTGKVGYDELQNC
ncbi:MAG: xanthine dehydrogenase family protein molybdopterin-binding subunit [Bacillota bacterium]